MVRVSAQGLDRHILQHVLTQALDDELRKSLMNCLFSYRVSVSVRNVTPRLVTGWWII